MAEASPVQDAPLSSNATGQGAQSADTSFRCQITMEKLTQTFREDTLEIQKQILKDNSFTKLFKPKKTYSPEREAKLLLTRTEVRVKLIA